MVAEEKITLEPVTPHLKFKRDNWGNILSLQYKEDGFSEEPGNDEKPDLENPITEYNPFEDMIFESKDECDLAIRRFAVHFASELRTDRNPHDFFSVEKGHYLYEAVILNSLLILLGMIEADTSSCSCEGKPILRDQSLIEKVSLSTEIPMDIIALLVQTISSECPRVVHGDSLIPFIR